MKPIEAFAKYLPSGRHDEPDAYAREIVKRAGRAFDQAIRQAAILASVDAKQPEYSPSSKIYSDWYSFRKSEYERFVSECDAACAALGWRSLFATVENYSWRTGTHHHQIGEKYEVYDGPQYCGLRVTWPWSAS